MSITRAFESSSAQRHHAIQLRPNNPIRLHRASRSIVLEFSRSPSIEPSSSSASRAAATILLLSCCGTSFHECRMSEPLIRNPARGPDEKVQLIVQRRLLELTSKTPSL